jgi:hypothetical protein
VVPGLFSVVGSRYHNPDTGYSVLSVKPPDSKEVFTAICTSPVRIIEGMNIEIHKGRWVRNKKYGRQFRVDSFSIPEPSTPVGVEKFPA